METSKFTTRKGLEITLNCESCNEHNEYFVKKLQEINSTNHGRAIKNALPDVHGVIWARLGDEVVGSLFYDLERSKDSGGVWVVLAHVEPAYRQQGIYKELHNALSLLTKEIGRNKVVTWFNINNQKMFQIGKSVGYQGAMVIMERRIDEQ
jgi:GNAT superfamily N-acetyltransferase